MNRRKCMLHKLRNLMDYIEEENGENGCECVDDLRISRRKYVSREKFPTCPAMQPLPSDIVAPRECTLREGARPLMINQENGNDRWRECFSSSDICNDPRSNRNQDSYYMCSDPYSNENQETYNMCYSNGNQNYQQQNSYNIRCRTCPHRSQGNQPQNSYEMCNDPYSSRKQESYIICYDPYSNQKCRKKPSCNIHCRPCSYSSQGYQHQNSYEMCNEPYSNTKQESYKVCHVPYSNQDCQKQPCNIHCRPCPYRSQGHQHQHSYNSYSDHCSSRNNDYQQQQNSLNICYDPGSTGNQGSQQQYSSYNRPCTCCPCIRRSTKQSRKYYVFQEDDGDICPPSCIDREETSCHEGLFGGQHRKFRKGQKRTACPLSCCKSREIRGGNLIIGCDCDKHNGLQDRCPRFCCIRNPKCKYRPAACYLSRFSCGKHLPDTTPPKFDALKRQTADGRACFENNSEDPCPQIQSSYSEGNVCPRRLEPCRCNQRSSSNRESYEKIKFFPAPANNRPNKCCPCRRNSETKLPKIPQNPQLVCCSPIDYCTVCVPCPRRQAQCPCHCCENKNQFN